MRNALVSFVLVLSACIAAPSSVRAQRQLEAAARSTGDVLAFAHREAPELVGALEAVQSALSEAEQVLAREGRVGTLESTLALIEAAILLATEQPKIAFALVAVKAALLQLQAASYP